MKSNSDYRYCLHVCTEKRAIVRVYLIGDMYSKHVLSVVVLSSTPLNDLLMASPETRARSRAPHSLAIRIAFTRDSLAPDAAIATGSLAVHPAMMPERNLLRAPYCISQSCCNASSRPLCHTHPQRFQGRKQGPDFQDFLRFSSS